MKPKYWAIIILAAVAIGASAVYHAQQPTQDNGPIVINHKAVKSPASGSQTDDWKTYTNNDYGFEFSYPSSWKLEMPDYWSGSPTNYFYLNKDIYGPGLSLKVRLTKEEDTKKINTDSLFIHTESQDTDVSKGLLFCSQLWRLIKNNVLFEFSSDYYSDQGNCYITYEVSNKIISSFKFLNPNGPYGLESWDTYTNNDFGFEFKYPKYVKVGEKAPNSNLGSTDEPMPGFFVGHFVFVVATNKSKVLVADYAKNLPINNDCSKFDGPCRSCKPRPIENLPNAWIVECGGEGGLAYYGFIPHNDYEIFVDSYLDGWTDSNKLFKNGALQEEDMDFILSSIKFIK